MVTWSSCGSTREVLRVAAHGMSDWQDLGTESGRRRQDWAASTFPHLLIRLENNSTHLR